MAITDSSATLDTRPGEGCVQKDHPAIGGSYASLVQGSPQWHTARAGKLTGSVFAAALGLSKYCSRQKLWRVLTGREAPDVENDAMRWGTRNEPVAIDWYECDRGVLVRPIGFLVHPRFDWLGVSPDGYVDSGRIEVKCPAAQIPHESIPEHYMPQCVGVLHITGGEWLDFISWTPEKKNVFRITAEQTLEQWKQWEAQLNAYWHDYILADIQPPRKRKNDGKKI